MRVLIVLKLMRVIRFFCRNRFLMMDTQRSPFFLELSQRVAPKGGFAERKGGHYRPDSTAWAALALKAAGVESDLLASARDALAGKQLADGSVCIGPYSAAIWPTPLAVLAWQGSKAHQEARVRAVDYLLKTENMAVAKTEDSTLAHDMTIKGWPWIANTSAWVEPTSCCMIAIRSLGHQNHQRMQEGVRLLLDRMFSSGGWNYGNTIVFGSKLYPDALNTGAALCALAGQVERKSIQVSLDYLLAEVKQVRAPLSLGWGLLGLSAWGVRPDQADNWVFESLRRQEGFAPYGTSQLGLLICAALDRRGFADAPRPKEPVDEK